MASPSLRLSFISRLPPPLPSSRSHNAISPPRHHHPVLSCDKASDDSDVPPSRSTPPLSHQTQPPPPRKPGILTLLHDLMAPRQKGDIQDVVLMSLAFAVYVYISQKLVCAYCVWQSSWKHF